MSRSACNPVLGSRFVFLTCINVLWVQSVSCIYVFITGCACKAVFQDLIGAGLFFVAG